MFILEENLVFDYNRCLDVVKSLDDYFKDRQSLATVEFPDSIEYKSKEYYIYMFYSCLLDYGMRSKIYHKNLISTYEKYSEIFNPKRVLVMDEENLRDIIVNNIHPRYPNVALKKWIELSRKLVEYDDILKTLKNINSFQELNDFVKETREYGQKTGGLLIRIISDAEVCNFKESVGSIPIDRHDIEISYLVGIVNSLKLKDKDIEKLSNLYVKSGKELDINPSDIDKYLWEIGVTFCSKKKCEDCPLKCYCVKSGKNLKEK